MFYIQTLAYRNTEQNDRHIRTLTSRGISNWARENIVECTAKLNLKSKGMTMSDNAVDFEIEEQHGKGV